MRDNDCAGREVVHEEEVRDIIKNEEPNTTTHEWPTVTTADE